MQPKRKIMANFFLPIYQNLEKETLKLAENIFFNDEQLSVYSIKVAELLIRTVVEIESLSKELYVKNDGKKEKPFFDRDCLDLLEKRWTLSKKQVIITSPWLDFQQTENRILIPLHNANQCGPKAPDWAQAYQAVKHDRSKNLKRANIKMLIRALAALYILNIYNKTDQEIKREATPQDTSFGSQIFSAKKQSDFVLPLNLEDIKQQNDKSCICIEKFPDYTYKKILKANKEDIIKRMNFFRNSPEGKSFLQQHPGFSLSDINILSISQFRCSKFFSECMTAGQAAMRLLLTSPKEIMLNKGQEIYPD